MNWTEKETGSHDITFESLQKTIDNCRELLPTDVPDVYVMTTAAFRCICEFVSNAQPSPLAHFDAVAVFGIPIEHYETLQEARNRCLELRSYGKRVALVCQ